MHIKMTPGAAAVFASGKRAIFVTAHVGNWEISAHALVASGARLAAIYSPLSNPLVDWAMRRYRGVFPCEYMPKDNAMRTWLRKGEDELKAKFNAGIAKVIADGTYEKISAPYFASSIYGG
jgi:lauroyl/myristoyl acyltransferase